MRAPTAPAHSEVTVSDLAGTSMPAEAAGREAFGAERLEAERFEALWRRRVSSPPSPDGGTVYAALRRLYEAPDRLFHNLDHIRDCLRRFDEVARCISRIRTPSSLRCGSTMRCTKSALARTSGAVPSCSWRCRRVPASAFAITCAA